MPYHVVKHGAKFVVEKKDGSKSFGSHATKEGAEKQMAAMYANEPKVMRQLHLAGATGTARTETYDGREHLVVPVVALIGDNVIHAVNASSPEFVPASALSAQGWDGRPLMLGHPTRDGRQVSANDPRVMERQGFGFMSASKMNGKRLGTEAWIDVARLEKLGQAKMLEDLRAGKPIEVSVGAFVQTRERAGTHLGKNYKQEWANVAPDHLAFLPGGVGACSVEMGCGSGRFAHLVTAEGIEVLGGPGSGPHPSDKGADAAKSALSTAGKWFGGVHESEHASLADTHAAAKGAHEHLVSQGFKQTGEKSVFGAPNGKETSYAHSNGQTARITTSGLTGKSGAMTVAVKGKALKTAEAYMMKDLKNRVLALFDTPEQAASEEAAELIAYNSMRTMLDAVGDQWDEASGLVNDLIADEEENPTETPGQEDAEEEVEDARLDAIRMLCYSMQSALSNVCSVTYKQQQPDLPSTSDPRYGEAIKALIGKAISAKNMKVIQGAHDASHDTHAHTVALGAECNGMKLLEAVDDPQLKAACSCTEGATMTGQERTAALKTITELKDAKFTDDELKGLALLSDKGIASLHALASKTPADSIIQAKYAADAALAGHAHGLNAVETAAKAKADAKAKDEADVKAAEGNDALKAAQAAGFKTIEEHEQAEFFKKNPVLKALVDRQQAQDEKRKTELLAALKGGPLTDEQLKAKPLDELETLAAYAKVEAVDYSGRGLAQHDDKDVYANPPDPYALALEARKKASVN